MWFDLSTERKKWIKCECGSKAERDFCAELEDRSHVSPIRHESLSMAVDVSELESVRKEDKAHGVEADSWNVHKDGTAAPVFHSVSKAREYIKSRGFFDRDSYV
jgi:hypothetical protein